MIISDTRELSECRETDRLTDGRVFGDEQRVVDMNECRRHIHHTAQRYIPVHTNNSLQLTNSSSPLHGPDPTCWVSDTSVRRLCLVGSVQWNFAITN